MPMKKYTLNKNVIHNGKNYAKGSSINKDDEGFSDILNAGHLEIHNFDDGKVLEEPTPTNSEPPVENNEAAPEAAAVVNEEKVDDEKPSKPARRR